MTDELHTLTRTEVDAAPVGAIVRTTTTKRCEVAIKIDMANRSSMGRWRTTTGMQFDFAIAHAGAVLLVPEAVGATPGSRAQATAADAHPRIPPTELERLASRDGARADARLTARGMTKDARELHDHVQVVAQQGRPADEITQSVARVAPPDGRCAPVSPSPGR